MNYEERAFNAENECERLRARVAELEQAPLNVNETLARRAERAEADLAAARTLLLEARDKVEWIGCSGEGYGAMIAMRDEFIVRIDATLAGDMGKAARNDPLDGNITR